MFSPPTLGYPRVFRNFDSLQGKEEVVRLSSSMNVAGSVRTTLDTLLASQVRNCTTFNTLDTILKFWVSLAKLGEREPAGRDCTSLNTDSATTHVVKRLAVRKSRLT